MGGPKGKGEEGEVNQTEVPTQGGPATQNWPIGRGKEARPTAQGTDPERCVRTNSDGTRGPFIVKLE